MSSHAVPPGGWKYFQGNVAIISDSREGLISNIKHHRLSNGMQMGDIEKDMRDQFKEKFPSFIIQEKPIAIIHGH